MSYDYQAVVIGAGTGGYPCAIRLGQLGVKTLIVDKGEVGGVCLNVGCIPSKALITVAKKFDGIKKSSTFGINVAGDVTIDMNGVQDFKESVVGKLTGGVAQLLKANGAEHAQATARIVDPHTVELTSDEGTRTVTAENIVVATGSRPIQIPGFEYADAPILDSTKALALRELPGRMVVIGGGYIGLELGMMYAKLGTEVTVVEMQDTVLFGFDKDSQRTIKRQLKKMGVTVHTNTKALGWEQADDGILVNVETPKGPLAIPSDYCLVTVGRFPNTEGFGLQELGVEMDGRFVQTDNQCRTNIPSIFAAGDVSGQPMLAHHASYEGELIAEVIAGHHRVYDARQVPAVVFTTPEIATVGMSEEEAKARGPIKVGKVPFAAIGRALTQGDSDGFLKVIADADTNIILGVNITGPSASDLISEASLAVEMVAELGDVALTIHAHPTMGEGLMEAAKAALGEAIHVINR